MKRHIDQEKEVLRTWVEIDRAAARANIKAFRTVLPKGMPILGIVKSNAYGHGLVDWSVLLQELKIDWLGVDSLVEAETLRKHGVTVPILVLGYTLPALLPLARTRHVALTISSFEQLEHVVQLPRSSSPLRIHIKVDTGMHRQGFLREDAPKLLAILTQKDMRGRFVVEGLYTHFAKAKDPRDKDMTKRQIAEFEEWCTLFAKHGIEPIAHAGATSGALLFPAAHGDMVRIGAGLYGVWPSRDTERAKVKQMTLRPALSWRALVSEVKTVKKGERVGYDSTELLHRDTVIAIVPVGYWHGFSRALSGKARVLIHGKFARVLGRVSMNMITVDVTDIPRVLVGDTVTLIGRDGKESVSADELAALSGTTHYEFLTRLNPLMKRFIV